MGGRRRGAWGAGVRETARGNERKKETGERGHWGSALREEKKQREREVGLSLALAVASLAWLGWLAALAAAGPWPDGGAALFFSFSKSLFFSETLKYRKYK